MEKRRVSPSSAFVGVATPLTPPELLEMVGRLWGNYWIAFFAFL
jgi:hypothetical protein